MLGRMHTRLSMLLVLFSSVTRSQVFPSSYTSPNDGTKSVNGSSATGNCSNVTTIHSTAPVRCDTPTSSVLFDGNIPTLTGLGRNMSLWASQLLTLQITNKFRNEISFDFKDILVTLGYVGLERIELVMFNCPEWGISVQTIGLVTAPMSGARSVVGTFTVPTNTSCDSLVRICISQNLRSEQVQVITLQFNPPPGSSWAHLAEVTFYGIDSQDTITPTLPSPDTIVSLTPDTTITGSNAPGRIETPSMPPSSFSSSTSSSSSSSSIITIATSIGFVAFLLIVCLLAAVLILWRCYYVRHRKHNISHHPAVGEGHANTRSHPTPVTLCEETGQVYYSTPQEVVPQESNDTHSHTHHDTITGRGASKKSREGTAAEDVEMGGYSMLSYGDKPQDGGSDNQNEEILLTPAKQDLKNEAIGDDGLHAISVHQLYTQVDKKKEKDGDTTHLHTPDTPVDQLYAQVDKKKRKIDGNTTHLHTPEADTVDQLYAQVEKKKKKDGDTTHSRAEIDTPVDQLYAEVDKKKKSKEKEMCKDSPQESGAVYSVVKKPHPPQLPAKSDLLVSDLYNC